ncbi:MAG: hypothetical protein WC458_01455 [Patescibacteria group bacterium]
MEGKNVCFIEPVEFSGFKKMKQLGNVQEKRYDSKGCKHQVFLVSRTTLAKLEAESGSFFPKEFEVYYSYDNSEIICTLEELKQKKEKARNAREIQKVL